MNIACCIILLFLPTYILMSHFSIHNCETSNDEVVRAQDSPIRFTPWQLVLYHLVKSAHFDTLKRNFQVAIVLTDSSHNLNDFIVTSPNI